MNTAHRRRRAHRHTTPPWQRAERRPRAARRLVFVVTSGVTAAFLKGLLSHLRVHGYDVTVIASPADELFDVAAADGVRALALPMRREPSPFADLRSLGVLLSRIRRIRPEIVVTATPKASLLGMLVAAATGVPVRVYQLWGLRLETERGARRLVYTALEALTMRLATHVVANSPSLAQEAQRIAGRGRIVVLGEGSDHGVDLTAFDARAQIPELPTDARTELGGNRLVVGAIGRVHRDKGTLVLLEAMRRVASARPATLLVVGRGEDPEIEEELRRPHGALRVIRVDSVDDPRPWFLAMDIHVLATLREGFPNVVLEAAALLVPTITTTATGARDSVVPEVTGLLVPPADAAALQAAIERLADDPELRRELALAARSRVERSFSSVDMWDRQRTFLEQARHPRARLGLLAAEP